VINTKLRARIRTKAQHSKRWFSGRSLAAPGKKNDPWGDAQPQLWRQDNPALSRPVRIRNPVCFCHVPSTISNL
jgi:hypothetical protein